MRTGPFFPPKTISWYMARLFIARSAGVLAGLIIVLMALDLLGESGNILAYPGNGDAALWHYVSLRVPQLVQRFLPFAILLGTLITLVAMNQNSEIISMKAAGISAHQILAPLFLASLAVAALSFWFNDHVVARATAALSAWQDVDYGKVPDHRGIVSNVWVRAGEDLIHADTVTGRGARTVLHRVSLYDRAGDRLMAITTADTAAQGHGGWVLRNVREFNVGQGTVTPRPTLVIGRGVTADRFTLSSVDPDGLSFRALNRAIGDLRAAGRPTASLQTVLWHKLSGPLSAFLMPLLASVAGFGLARSGKMFIRAVIGMALGFAYFVADNFALAMGNIGAYPPLLAAWAPFLLFLLIGEAVLIRTEE
ncbi:LPS export ABC transporter permease LptG [uncultured Sphingomonas sp.]|uniref:LPS export ABC transporter permease LptG n=1 Tax=uncultured Sphingomonas sp. TaxID=158754 RepID=UPI0025EAC872|nr:LPS export ABC transporter permease LptG [uncultured Sphingomonas sp.]